jgi:hypothetical protein
VGIGEGGAREEGEGDVSWVGTLTLIRGRVRDSPTEARVWMETRAVVRFMYL